MQPDINFRNSTTISCERKKEKLFEFKIQPCQNFRLREHNKLRKIRSLKCEPGEKKDKAKE